MRAAATRLTGSRTSQPPIFAPRTGVFPYEKLRFVMGELVPCQSSVRNGVGTCTDATADPIERAARSVFPTNMMPQRGKYFFWGGKKDGAIETFETDSDSNPNGDYQRSKLEVGSRRILKWEQLARAPVEKLGYL